MPDKKVADLAAKMETREDMIWRQMYAADVLPALKKEPEASLKKEAKFEFGHYAKAAGTLMGAGAVVHECADDTGGRAHQALTPTSNKPTHPHLTD